MGASIESRVIPAKAGIQFVRVTWTPAYAGVTPWLSLPWVGCGPMTIHNDIGLVSPELRPASDF
jgi:hypothetical protein